MKNAKIVKIAPTVAACKLAAQIICAQKHVNKGIDLTKKPAPKRAAAAPTDDAVVSVGTAVMESAVTSGKKAATKVENYSAEVTEKLLSAWSASDKSKAAVEKLATEFGKTARSIVAKLSREKVYVKQEYVTKSGTAPVSKEEIVAVIAAFCGVDADKLDSLEKANKGVLQLLQDVLTKTAHNDDNQRAADEAQADKDNELYAAQ